MLQDLLTLGFDSAILLISSYANPVDTLQHARNQGYQVTDFMVPPMPFGYYNSEPKVPKPWLPCTVSTRHVCWTLQSKHVLCCCMQLLCCCKLLSSDTLTGNSFCIRCQVLNGSDADQGGAAHGMLRYLCMLAYLHAKRYALSHGHVP